MSFDSKTADAGAGMQMNQNGHSKDQPQQPAAKVGVAKRFAPILVILAGLGAGYLFGLHEFLSFESLVEHRDSLMLRVMENIYLSSLIYVGLYIVAVAFSFPAASLLTIIGGFLFGWLLGGTLTAIGATIGATIIYLAARTAMGDFLKKMAGPGVAKLADGFRDNAFSFLLVLRLAPIFPFFAMNIAPALFNVPVRTYIVATFIGILPGTYAYAYLGQGLDSVILSAREAGRDVALTDLVTPELTIAFAALALVAAIPFVVKKLRAGR